MSEDIVKGVSRALARGVSRAVLALCAAASAVTFDVDVEGVRPALLEAYRGESFEIAARFPQDFGVSSARFLWMTNTAANADVFATNATVSADGVVRTVFTGAMDAGAPVVPFFFAAETRVGTCLRASGMIRFRPSPGVSPSIEPFPSASHMLDFSQIEALNAPWTTWEAVEALVRDATNGIPAPPPAPDLSPYATKEEVASKIAASTNALVASIPQPDLAPYCTIEAARAMDAAVSNALAEAVASIRVPSLAGYATEAWVASALAGISQPDLSPYATKAYADAAAADAAAGVQVPSLEGYATKSELDALKRRYADTNGVTRLWSEDGLTMTDGTGVVWSVSWAATTNWVSLTNGIVYRPTAPGVWIGDGIITNREGTVGVGRIEYVPPTPGQLAFGLDGGGGFSYAEAKGLYLDYSDEVVMLPDAFTGIVERAALYVPMARVVTNAVGYVANGIITDGTNTITAAGDATAAGIGKGYWMVRRIPDGAWRKLVPVPESYNALWRDVETNSYVGDYSGAPDGMWTGSVDGFSNTFYIPAERYEAFSNSNVEGYYVPDRKTLATVDQIPTTPEQIGAYTRDEVDTKVSDLKTDVNILGFQCTNLNVSIVSHINNTDNPHKVTAGQVGAATPEDVSAAANSAVATANAYTDGQTTPLWSYLGAESFRVVVTNYDSAVHPPVASFEYRMTTNEAFRTVWNETNGLNRAIATATNLAHQAAKKLVDDPANRAWGKYDSETGEASPEGVIQATAPGGLIVGGGQRWSQISAESGWWILTSTDPTLCRTGTNGVFSIIGSDGQEAIRIVKGSKVTVPAPADSISVESGVCTVTYAVEAEQHPTAQFASKLGGEAGTVWYNEGDADCPVTMTWSGTSGNYVLTFDTAGLSAGFVQATYEQGQESYTSFGGAGLELTKIRIGGKVYTVGTATIDGKTVLTLQ